MKSQQVVALLLCALLGSTLAHDYMQAKEIHHPQHQNKLASREHQHQRHHPKLQQHNKNHQRQAHQRQAHQHLAHQRQAHPKSHLKVRDSANISETCHLQCPPASGGGDITLYVNASIELIGLVNISADVAIVFDIEANLIGLFNGNNGSAIIIDISAETGVYIAGDGTELTTWLSANVDFAVFFEGLASLSVFLSVTGAISFNTDTDDDNILGEVLAILICLDQYIVFAALDSLSALLSYVIGTYGVLFQLLQGVLCGLFELLGDLVCAIYGDVLWLINILVGIGKLLANISGGLEYLIGLGLTIDFAALLILSNGFYILASLLVSLGNVIGLGELGDCITDPFTLLDIIVYLGGAVTSGLTGALRVVLAVVLNVQGDLSFDLLVEVLLKVSISGSIDIDLEASVGVLLDACNSQTNSSTELDSLISILEEILDGTLEIVGVTVVGVIQAVLGTLGTGLTLVVSVFVAVGGVLSLVVSLTQLLLCLLGILLSGTGSLIFLLGLVISGLFSAVGQGVSIIGYIVKNTNVLKIVAAFPNLDKILRLIPIVSEIYIAIVGATSSCTNGTVSFPSLLTGNVICEIVSWLNQVFGIHISCSG